MATLQGKAVKNTYRQVLQIGANNVGVSGTLQPVQDGAGNNTALSLSTLAATVNGDLTITGDLIITGGGIQIQDLIDDTVATLIQNGTGITWAYNDTARTLTPTITIATADGGVQGDYLQLNTNANEASAVGKLKWNTTDGTLDIGLMGGQVVLQVGQEQVARVLNNSGSILTEAGYQAVKITSAQGQRLAVGLAQANNEANSKDTLGLVTENIANNQEGFVTTSGLVRQIDTTGDLQSEVWVDGDTLYLSPTVPGGVTKVKPLAPQQTVIVGFVVYAHKTQGKIFVKVDNGYEISELHDVRITSVANNNILKYNSSLSVWENVAGTTTNIAEGTNLYYTQARFDSAFAAKTTTNLAEGTNLYFTTARGDANFATNFATKTTTNLPEGTNLYFTNARSRGALSVTAGTGISYNSSTGNFELSAIPNASLANDDVTINGSAVALGGSLTLTTSDIAEGTNLYWTNARFDSRFSTKTTTDLAEGTNLYYTQARFNTAFSAKSTTDLAEGTNLYYTDARARAAFSENAVGLDYSAGSGVLSLTSGYAIPTTVKLGEYDTAYNRSIVSAAVTGTSTKTLTLTEQDASTITATWTDQGITTINGTANQIATSTVGNTTTVGFTNDVTFPNNVVVSGNLTINGTATYVNTQSISSKDPLFEVANDNNTTDAVDIGYYGRYYDSAQTRVEFTGLFRDASDAGKYKIFSGLVDEPTNVVDTTGTGYTVGTLVANVEGNLAGTANAANVLSTARSISATGDAAWTVSFDGSANATAALTLANTGVTATTYGTSTSVPTIAVDGKGRITSASNTAINFPVTTVNSLSGNVVLTTSDVAEGTNQYFTTGRVSAYLTGAISPVLTADLTASRALVSDGSGKITASASATATEVSYLAGVTSAIQTQLNSKLNLTGGTLTGALSGTSATFSGNMILSGTDSRLNGGDSVGRLILSNSSTSTYIALYGASHASVPNVMSFVVNSSPALTINANGTLIQQGNGVSPVSLQLTSVNPNCDITLQSTGSSNVVRLRNNADDFQVHTNGLQRFTIASTGAATFSSSVTANGDISAVAGVGIVSGGGGYVIGPTSTRGIIAINGSGDQILTFSTQSYIYNSSSLFRLLSSNDLDFAIGGTQRMIIKAASGNLGIGTSSPAALTEIRVNTNDYGNNLILSNNYPNNNIATSISFGHNTAAAETDIIARISGYIDDRTAGNRFGSLRFYTGNAGSVTERMRITSGGFLKASNTGSYPYSGTNVHEIVSSASDNTLIINNSSATPSGIFMYYNAAPNNTGQYFLNIYDGNVSTKRFAIRSNGGLENYQANDVNLSDERTKKDIIPLESYWDKFKSIEIVKFKYKDQTHDDFNIGVIAQQVESVAPEFIDVDGWGETLEGEEPLKSVYTADLHHATIKVLQEAMAKIENLESKIAILEAK